MKKTVILFFVISLILSGCIFDKEEKNYTNLPSNYMNETLTEDMMVYDYSIYFPTPTKLVFSPGEKKNESFVIRNNGRKADSIIFEGEYRREINKWVDFSSLPEVTYLKPGKEMQLNLLVNIPEDAEIGSSNSITVRARRQSTNEIIGSTDFALVVVDKK